MKAPIALLTDFGQHDPFVGVMKGVIAGIAPRAPVIDVCHEVAPRDVRAAALHLRASAPYFPEGTIFVCVVDPGVGSERRVLWARTARQRFLAPDNGLLSWLAEPPLEWRHVDNAALWLPQVGATFHGRDVFAPTAARLWSGARESTLGPSVDGIKRIPFPAVRKFRDRAVGEILHIDRFGNAVTNLDASVVSDARVFFRGRSIGRVASRYAAVGTGRPVAVLGSLGFAELAVRDGDFARCFRAKAGDRVECRG